MTLTQTPTPPTLKEIAAEWQRRRYQRYPDLWISDHFREPESGGLIHLYPFQRAVLRYATQRDAAGALKWRTVVWSQPKKSGKTTVSGAVGRWAAETWGPYQLVLCVGNDAGQAKERAFAAIAASIEMQDGYDRKRRELPDTDTDTESSTLPTTTAATATATYWRVREDELLCRNGSLVKAIAADYSGEAGANPSLSIYTELWGFIHTGHLRFWAEMAPSPTRKNSMRWVETYAGYEGESELLWGLYNATVLEGRQLTAGELEAMARSDAELAGWLAEAEGPLFAEAPLPDDPVPCYVNEAAGIFAFWDSGEQARRMPWQQGERGAAYYANEAATQTPAQYTRLHLNEWVSGESPFIPIEWWDACGLNPPPPLLPGDRTPLVVALDAAVTGDCFGMVAVSRDPDAPLEQPGVCIRLARKWTPEKGKPLDFAGPEAVLRQWCRDYHVVEVTYDPYQLHEFATRLQKDSVAWFRPFPQGVDRLRADKGLYDLIRDRRIRHDGNPELREHIQNCNAKMGKQEDTKLRLIKKSETRKIDLAVCGSMGSSECLRLMV